MNDGLARDPIVLTLGSFDIFFFEVYSVDFILPTRSRNHGPKNSKYIACLLYNFNRKSKHNISFP